MTLSLRQQVWGYRYDRRKFFQSERKGILVYSTYHFSKKEQCVYYFISTVITVFFCQFFYRSLWSGLALWPVGLYVYQKARINHKKKRVEKLEIEFKDCILSVSANLRAGYSIENAFIECQSDMLILYGKDSLIVKELKNLQKGIHNNSPLEFVLHELGERSTNEIIKEFAEVFSIARKSGGNLPEIIQSTVQIISQEISIRQDIQVMISGRLFEQKMMNVIPFLLVLYIELTNPGFFDPLYHNMIGCVVMTCCMVVYIVSYLCSKRICALSG